MGANEKLEAALGQKPLLHIAAWWFGGPGSGAYCGEQAVDTAVTEKPSIVTCPDCRAIILIHEQVPEMFVVQRSIAVQYWREKVLEIRKIIDAEYGAARMTFTIDALERLEEIVEGHSV